MTDLMDFGGWPLAGLLPEKTRRKIEASGRRFAFSDGELVHSRGDAAIGLSIIVEGAVRFGLVSAAGGYVEMSRMGPGHCFGEATIFAGMPRVYDAWADGETVIRVLTEAAVWRLVDEEPDFTHALLKATTRRLYDTLEFSHDLRRLPTHVHAAKLINAMRLRAEDKRFVEVKQTDLADTLGVSRVAIGAALSKLQAVGVIRLGYGRIWVDDPVKLEGWLANKDIEKLD
jgi:CRP-like cAMP-binding protein